VSRTATVQTQENGATGRKHETTGRTWWEMI
jgi:hypothetical protein